MRLIAFCEAAADFRTAADLLDRVLREEGPSWIADPIDEHPELSHMTARVSFSIAKGVVEMFQASKLADENASRRVAGYGMELSQRCLSVIAQGGH